MPLLARLHHVLRALLKQPQPLRSDDAPETSNQEEMTRSGLCAFCLTPSAQLDPVWNLCPACIADQLAWENDFTLLGTCTECGTPQVGLNSGGLCHPCVHDFDDDGTCYGCGAQRRDLNRWNVCRRCAHDVEHQVFPPEPDDLPTLQESRQRP